MPNAGSQFFMLLTLIKLYHGHAYTSSPTWLPPTAPVCSRYKDWWAPEVKQMQALGKTCWGLEPEGWRRAQFSSGRLCQCWWLIGVCCSASTPCLTSQLHLEPVWFKSLCCPLMPHTVSGLGLGRGQTIWFQTAVKQVSCSHCDCFLMGTCCAQPTGGSFQEE